MTTMRWFQSGASPRGTPASGRLKRRHPVVLLALALVALTQAGCQSGPFGGCGSCGGRLRDLSERAFRPFRNLGARDACCGTEGAIVGAPVTVAPSVVVPGVAVPSGTGTTPAEPLPSNGLEPVPSASPGPPASGDSTGSKSGAGKANYEAYRPSNRDSLNQSLNSTPEPTTRSAQGSSLAQNEPNPLDNLPPLDLPREVARADTPRPASVRTLTSEPAVPAAATSESLADLAAKAAKADPGTTVVPGIRKFAGVEAKLAGGTLPSAAGLDWLGEKGYKTVLDIREESAISPAFISDVSRRGMRYVALPMNAKTIDADHVNRFQLELSLSDARPLFFFDTDGTRAAILWYIRRVTVDHVEPQVAKRDAEEIGTLDPSFLAAADAYIASVRPAPAPAAVETAKPNPAPAPAVETKPSEANPIGANAPAAPSAGPPPVRAVDASEPADAIDPIAWKPIAALVLTGLGVPLAYVSRVSNSTSAASMARASLTAPRPSEKSLPGRSDG